MDEKYSDWLKNQNSIVQSFENGQEILHHKEKTVAIFEALVQCCQTIISDREGDQIIIIIIIIILIKYYEEKKSLEKNR